LVTAAALAGLNKGLAVKVGELLLVSNSAWVIDWEVVRASVGLRIPVMLLADTSGILMSIKPSPAISNNSFNTTMTDAICNKRFI
jgi:hypothetical protein